MTYRRGLVGWPKQTQRLNIHNGEFCCFHFHWVSYMKLKKVLLEVKQVFNQFTTNISTVQFKMNCFIDMRQKSPGVYSPTFRTKIDVDRNFPRQLLHTTIHLCEIATLGKTLISNRFCQDASILARV